MTEKTRELICYSKEKEREKEKMSSFYIS